ncbi:MAG: HAMP domain-containing sensor histidine kinase [Bacteroidota bacterium]
MKIKLDYLIFLSIFATIGIIAFQISWLKTSYEISREKIKNDATAKLEQAVKMHEESVAKTIRAMVIKAIKANPNFYIKIPNRFKSFQIGYNGPNGEIRDIGPLFNLTRDEAKQARENSYNFFINRIGSANIEELNYLCDNVIGPYLEFDLYKERIYKAFHFHRDTATLNKFLRLAGTKEPLKVNYKTEYFVDILNVFGQQPKEYDENDKGAIDSTTIWLEASYYKLSMGEKLDSLETDINYKNKTGNLIYVAQPLYDIDNILNNRSPVILLTIDAPISYILSQMLFSLIGSGSLLLLVSFCLIYMFHTILKQKKLSEIKDDFISNVSHELKTPVATTLAAIQGMQHFDVLKDEEKTEQYLGTAEKEMKRLSTMIDTILNSAIYERSDFNLHLIKFNLKELLMEMIGIQESHAKKEVKIELNYLATEEVMADKTHLYNVFINLIDNAIKYGNEKVQLKMECVDNDRELKIQITDNGNGIPIAYQKYIFDKFFRVPSPADHSIKGHGLGLNYVKNIIEKHKGTVTLLKSDANGSTFEINLPQ